ncbi:MAG: SDR family oxidoreductase, partial [Tepidiformaceae bacterium]
MSYTPRPLPHGGRRVAAVTGASSGFGEAIARELAASGFDVVIGARRTDRLERLAKEIGARALTLDVTNIASVEAFAREAPVLHVLVNNAGGALGLEPVAESVDEHWRTMWETNVFGLMAMTRA